MEKRDNHIDELFRNRLENYAPEPPPRVWERIESDLPDTQKHVRPLWRRWSTAAAVLLLALVTGTMILNSPRTTEKLRGDAITSDSGDQMPTDDATRVTMPATAGNLRENEKSGSGEKLQEISFPTEMIAAISSSGKAQLKPETESLPDPIITLASGRMSDLQLTAMVSIPGRVKTNSAAEEPSLALLHRPTPVTLQPALSPEWIAMTHPHGQENEKLTRKRGKTGSAGDWSVGMMLTPAYTAYAVNHSPEYARNMNASASQARTTVGAGISVTYKAAPRWRIESGMYYSRNGDAAASSGNLFAGNLYYDNVSMSQNATHSFDNPILMSMGTMTLNSTAGVISFSKKPENTSYIAIPESYAGFKSSMITTGEFYQVFEFMEIPVAARYRVIDKAVAVEIISGISSYLVVGNSVWAGNGSQRENVGKTEDISTLNLSGTVGVGIIYPLGNNLALSVEPRASYFLNSMNHSRDVNLHPWKTALYTGLSWNF